MKKYIFLFLLLSSNLMAMDFPMDLDEVSNKRKLESDVESENPKKRVRLNEMQQINDEYYYNLFVEDYITYPNGVESLVLSGQSQIRIDETIERNIGDINTDNLPLLTNLSKIVKSKNALKEIRKFTYKTALIGTADHANPINQKSIDFIRTSADYAVGQELIAAALKYEAKLRHMPSCGKFLSEGLFMCRANDFILRFAQSLGEVPSDVLSKVDKKYKSIAAVMPIKKNDCAFMCCWEFCALALMDAHLATQQQIDDICFIVFFWNEILYEIKDDIILQNQLAPLFDPEAEDNTLTLAHAFYQAPINSYQKYSEKELPFPGDLVIFYNKESNEPLHVAIAIDFYGEIIELNSDDKTVKRNSLIETEELFRGEFENDLGIFYVPASMISGNIKEFLIRYAPILEKKSSWPKLTSFELSADLDGVPGL